ncbi:MAG TPA: nuclear transport factor 2 family protein [Pyrinomonadaceae bacterium]|nr:nuclear transport factor 2 family protein [Pyrinomonadaceae bacterium]
MKRLFLVPILILAASSLAFGQGGDGFENAIKQLEEELRVAVLKRDTKAYAQLVADDYLFTTHNAIVRTKAQMLEGYTSGAIKYESLKFDDIKVRVYGDTAVVTGRSTSKGADQGQDFSGVFRYTRVYVKRPSGWQLVATQATRIP